MAVRTDGNFPWPTARAGAALVVLLLAVYLPGLGALPIVDRDEARFAQASRQMLGSVVLPAEERDRRPITVEDGRIVGGLHAGGAVVPMLGDRARLAKPPMIYWLQSASAWVFTLGGAHADAPWMYRVPSVLAAVVTCIATWRVGAGFGTPRAGWIAGLAVGVCPMMAWDARQARADQVLVACTTLALLALWRIGEPGPGRASIRWVLLFWAVAAVGTLTKGPVALLLVLAPVVALCVLDGSARPAARTRPLLGLALLGAALAPWLIAVGNRVGAAPLLRVLSDETLGRAVEGREGHWAPPGYHLVLLPVLLWPASLLMLRSIRQGLGAVRRRAFGPDAYLIVWVVPSWLVFEIVGTKLPHYTLPLYPALALLATRLAERACEGGLRGPTPNAAGVAVWTVIGAVLLVVAPIVLATIDGSPGAVFWAGMTAAGAGVLLLASAWRAWTGRPVSSVVLASLACGAMAAGVIGRVLPACASIWVTRGIAGVTGPIGDARVGAVGYHEDSLAFLARGRLDRLSEDSAASWARSNPGGVLVLPSAVAPVGGTVYLGSVRGLNYSKGEGVDLRVYRVPGPPDRDGGSAGQ